MGIASSRSTDQGFELPSYNANYYEYQNMFGNNVCDGYEQHGNKYHDMVMHFMKLSFLIVTGKNLT